uniref:Methylmalonic aciduria and homocystinuria type D protein, mitochondrial n=1 Tax=Strigamia maritima TaxID=126957 RepID=T1J8I1_STRMM
MALMNKGKRLVTFSPNMRSILQRLRTFSSSDKRTPQSSHVDFEDIDDADLVFSPNEEKRLPLPGNIGFSKPLISKKKQSVYSAKSHIFNDLVGRDRHKDVIFQAIHNEFAEATAETTDALVKLECVAQECPSLILAEFIDLFPDYNISTLPFTVLTLSQKTKKDMSEWNEEVDAEREELMSNFVNVAEKMCETLRGAGFWADFIDPFCGKPYLGPHTNATMFETDERYGYFGFTIEDLGCCKVIKHHLWGSHAFVGCIFTNAPVNDPFLKSVLSPGHKQKAADFIFKQY